MLSAPTLTPTSSRFSIFRLRLYANSTASNSSAATSTTTDEVKAQSEYRANPMSMCSVFMPRLPLASLRSSFALVFGCSYAMCLRFSLGVLPAALLPAREGQALRQPLELVAPSRVVGARQAAQLDVHRTRIGGCEPYPDPAPPHHQRHQKAGHHRHREHQHPHLRRIVGDLHVDERHRPVEADDRAVVEAGLLARTQVDPRLPGQPVLLDELRVEREERLRPSGIQSGVALVDVDGHRRV